MSRVTPLERQLERQEWARKYREAIQDRLGAERVEVAGVFSRHPDSDKVESIQGTIRWIWESMGRRGPLAKLRGTFLFGVTSDKVHAFKHRQRGSDLEIRDELVTFRRDHIRFITGARDELHLEVTEGDKTHRLRITSKRLEDEPGAAEVVAALSE
jgi:CHAD domain-containing protein